MKLDQLDAFFDGAQQRKITSCQDCQAVFSYKTSRPARCKPCTAAAKAAAAREYSQQYRALRPEVLARQRVRRMAKRREALNVSPIGAAIACEGCGSEIIKTAPTKRRCTPCSAEVIRQRNVERLARNKERYAAAARAKRAEKFGRPTLDAPVSCPECGAEFIRKSGFGKFCPPCRERGKWARTPEEKKAEVFARRRLARSKRAAADPKYLLNKRMSEGVKRALKLGKLGKSWREMVPFTLEELRTHIERQFLPGMTWDNMGEWHIDHRQPLKSFQFETSDDPEFRAAWQLTNLQPLWGADNVRKSAKRLYLL